MIVPELPEVESARAAIERAALHRSISDVDDTDTWECRPHAPGEIRVHTGTVIAHRRLDGHCPRCGATMQRATVGGRTTWFCPREQV